MTPHPGPCLAVIQHEDGCPLGLFDGWLRAAGARITVVRPYAGDPLPGVDRRDGGGFRASDAFDAFDGLVVLGGSMSATDDDRCPWLPATRELLRAAVRASTAIPGVITPVVINGRLLADGGMLNPVPIEPTAASGAPPPCPAPP